MFRIRKVAARCKYGTKERAVRKMATPKPAKLQAAGSRAEPMDPARRGGGRQAAPHSFGTSVPRQSLRQQACFRHHCGCALLALLLEMGKCIGSSFVYLLEMCAADLR